MTETPHPMDLVVLCGGRGVRLRPFTDRMPKALVPVAGRPIIDHVVDFLSFQGLDRIHLCIGYKGDVLREHFTATERNITFSDLGDDASMLQRLHAVGQDIAGRFLVAYCDTFVDIAVSDIVAHHMARGALATIVTAPIRNPFGIVSFNADGIVKSFQEKPLNHHFIGMLVMERAALDLVGPDLLAMPDGSGLVELFHRMIAMGKLAAYEHGGLNITFNTVPERQQADKALTHYYTVSEEEKPSPDSTAQKEPQWAL